MDIWTKMMSYTTIIICKMKRTTKNIQHNLHTTLNDIPFSHLFLCYNQRQWPVVHFRLGTDLISRCTLPATPSAQKPIVLMSWWHIAEKSKNHSILDVYYKALKPWEKYRTIVYINKSSYIYHYFGKIVPFCPFLGSYKDILQGKRIFSQNGRFWTIRLNL
jgi:hypothetical protein